MVGLQGVHRPRRHDCGSVTQSNARLGLPSASGIEPAFAIFAARGRVDVWISVILLAMLRGAKGSKSISILK